MHLWSPETDRYLKVESDTGLQMTELAAAFLASLDPEGEAGGRHPPIQGRHPRRSAAGHRHPMGTAGQARRAGGAPLFGHERQTAGPADAAHPSLHRPRAGRCGRRTARRHRKGGRQPHPYRLAGQGKRLGTGSYGRPLPAGSRGVRGRLGHPVFTCGISLASTKSGRGLRHR